jgi:hypothetical protein
VSLTNEHNFQKLPNLPAFEPTCCCHCSKVINLGEGGYSRSGGKYTCMECCSPEIRALFSRNRS